MIFKANYGKKLVIPETPLKYLKLPKEFILLTTKSLVYAADIDGEHLTIDIRCRKSRKKNKKYDFYVCQCYKSYNKPCKNETLQYVQECVEHSTEKAVEKYIKVNERERNL